MNEFWEGWYRYWLTFTMSWRIIAGFVAGACVATFIYECVKAVILLAIDIWMAGTNPSK